MTPDDLPSRIRNWLHDQGYPLELFAERTLREAGFSTTLGTYYRDPQTGDPREIDVTGYLESRAHNVPVMLYLIVECKLCKHPLLLFTSPSDFINRMSIMSEITNQWGALFMRRLWRSPDDGSLEALRVKNRVAYGMTEAFTSGKDVAYEAMMSAVKAAVARINEVENMFGGGMPFVQLAIPAIVIDGLLFECSLDDQGEIDIAQVSAGTIHWRMPIAKQPLNCIRVLTKSALGTYASELNALVGELGKRTPDLQAVEVAFEAAKHGHPIPDAG